MKASIIPYVFTLLLCLLRIKQRYCTIYVPEMTTRNYSYFPHLKVLALFSTDVWAVIGQQPVFESLIRLWSISSGDDPLSYVLYCSGSLYYMGKPGLQLLNGYFERTYNDLATHNIIYFSFVVGAGGSWQTTDTFSIQFDDMPPRLLPLYAAKTSSNIDLTTCASIVIPKMNVVGKVFHTASSLTVRISWNFAANSSPTPPFLTFRDVKLLFGTHTAADSEEIYVTLQDPAVVYSTKCTPVEYYEISLGSCQPCNSACFTCFGPSATQCYGSSYLYFYDGTASLNNPPGCRFAIGPNLGQCVTCLDNLALDQNSICTASCTAPFVAFTTGVAARCFLPCASGEFMMWNYACTPTCNPPLVKGTETAGDTCSYPCPKSINSFLHWDGSCVTTCQYYQRIENHYQFCDACQPGYYLYDNNLCLPECYAGFLQEYIGGSNFCHFPCSVDKYLYPDGSCQSNCIGSSLQKFGGTYGVCNLNLLQDEVKQVQKVSAAKKLLNTVQSAVSYLITVSSSANVASIFMNMLTVMPGHIKYLKINFPPKLQYMLDSDDVLSLHIIPDLPTKAEAVFPKFMLPDNFERFQMPSSFFVNFWTSSVVLTASLLVFLLACCLENFIKYKLFKRVFAKVKQTFKWNFLLALFFSKYAEIVLFSSFEFRSTKFYSIRGILSFLECFLINSISLFVLVKIFCVVIAIRKDLNNHVTTLATQSHDEAAILAKWKDYTMLFEPFKNQSLLHQMFVPLSELRIYVFYSITAYLYNYPLVQICSITLLNALMLFYIAKIRSPKRKIEMVEYGVQEVILLIINICVVVLAALDKASMEASTVRINLGGVIIWITVGYSSATTSYLMFKLLMQIIRAIKGCRSRSSIVPQIFISGPQTLDQPLPKRVGLVELSEIKLLGCTNQLSQSGIQLERLDQQSEILRTGEQTGASFGHSLAYENESPSPIWLNQNDIQRENNMDSQILSRKSFKSGKRFNQEEKINNYSNQIRNEINLSESNYEGHDQSTFSNYQANTGDGINQQNYANNRETMSGHSLSEKNETNENSLVQSKNKNHIIIRPKDNGRKAYLESIRAMNDPKNFYK